jgi:uncharacterized protein YcbK (DUF882 family)
MADKLLSANEKTNEQVTANFNLKELEYFDPIPKEFLDNARELCRNLQKIRDAVGKPLKIISGYRSLERQMKVNPSAPKSKHLSAEAADLQCTGLSATELHKIILDLIDKKVIINGGLGLYVKDNFCHFDIRRDASGKGIPARWTGN